MELSLQEKASNAKNIFKGQSLPMIPQEVLLLKEELTKKYPNTVTIANLISKNPENLSLFLKIANSNVVNQDTQIKDAKAAVNLIGLGDLFNLFLSSVLSRLLVTEPSDQEIMKEGVQTGIVAAELSYWVYDVSRSEAFMLGLLQNIGYLFMRRYDPNYDDWIAKLKTNPFTMAESESQYYQTDHAVLSSVLGRKWDMPDKIVKPVMFHHDKKFVAKLKNHDGYAQMVALIMVSSYIVYSSSDEQYLTQELKDYRDLGKEFLGLPDKALKAGRAALEKWGGSGNLISGSH
ncbi:HDOD domain-containing protein [Thiomicrorhabdus indica]|uniref:HDOD domain-containing protein n=1 Tax=Thiomicrorhabdus indica TaxID=2267253 RepID=UPI00102DE3BB|nr:HDOD domain-containing protein [Thiomicrorhabdus indica]